MSQILTTNNAQGALRLGVVSDIHLGHKRNRAESIILNLNKYLNNTAFLSSIDVLFLAGDVFDEMLHLSSVDVDHIVIWIAKLLRNCAKLKVVVRVLEGTPSHDRGQSKLFMTANEINDRAGVPKLNLKYIDTLSIEYIEQFGINVLYVPDEWGPTTEDTLDQVRVLLEQHQLTSVDYAIMHGLFNYQLGAHIPHIQRHDEGSYLSIVKHLIFIGHIHTHSTYERIIAQGSFDRLSHNEEEPKGFVRAVVQSDGLYQIDFMENATAATYMTINVADASVPECLLLIEHRIRALRPGSNVRIEAHHTHPILSNLSVLKERWPLLLWAVIARGKEAKITDVIIDHKSTYIPIVLDRQNLMRVVLERISPLGLTDAHYQHCVAHLSELTGVKHAHHRHPTVR